MTICELEKVLCERDITLSEREGKIILRPASMATKQVLAAVKEHKAAILQVLAAPDAAPKTAPASTCARVVLPKRDLVLRGQTVVANKHRDRDLVRWAEVQGLAVGIMRNGEWGSKWGNPFVMKTKTDAERERVCDEFAVHLSDSPELLAQIGELRGKVLVCCCHPKRCHGDALAHLANIFDVGVAYDPEAAITYAHELRVCGEVTDQQHANLIAYAK